MTSRNIQIFPSNKTTDGTYSFSGGQAQVTFDIPAGAYLLDPDSLRICGDFQVFKNEARDPPLPADLLTMNNRIGVLGCFQQLIWKSLKHQSVIEHNKHYNRWCSSYYSLVSNIDDQIGYLSQSLLTLPDYNSFKNSVVDKTVSQEFCCNLPCGLMNQGRSINIMPNALGGLSLTIMLESDANALQVLPADDDTAPDTTNFTTAYYELSHLSLICKVITPSPEDVSRLMKQSSGTMTLQTIHSYYDTAQSSNIQLAMNLGLRKVKSLFMNFISSSDLNNLSEDGFATLMPCNLDGSLANVKSIQFLKGGISYPKHYPNDTNYERDNNSILADPEIVKDYLNAVSPWDTNRSTLMSSVTSNRFVNIATNGKGIPYQFVNNGGVVWGIGLNYENFLGGEGIDMNGVQLGLNMDTELTSANAQSIFIFVNAETNIVWNENGVQVIN